MASLNDVVRELTAVLTNLVPESERVKKSGNIVEAGQFYKMLYESYKSLDELTSLLCAMKDEFSKTICPDLFEANGVRSISIGGKKLTLSAKVRANMPYEKLSTGINWLRDNGYGDIIKEGVNANTLSSAMSAYIEEKNEMPPENAMTIYIEKTISVRKE